MTYVFCENLPKEDCWDCSWDAVMIELLYFIYCFYFEKLMDFQSKAALYLREQYILFMSGSCIVYMKTLLTSQIWCAAAW